MNEANDTARVLFFYDVVCPYAYLAHTQIVELCERQRVPLEWKPILLGGLFRLVGAGEGPMASMPPAKARLNRLDMQRWAEHWSQPLTMPEGHPRRSVLALRAILASNDHVRASKALFAAYWVEGRDIADPSVVASTLSAVDFDGGALVEAASTQAIKDELRARTDEAAERGLFGVPSFVVLRRGSEPELYWGQDRMRFLEQSLAGMARAS
jgi:2-hydroxychromene-2-carboxylate isomerase